MKEKSGFQLLVAAAAAIFSVAWVGCAPGEPEPVQTGEQRFVVKGWVRGIAEDGETITIDHEEIPNFMPAMTMPFYLRDPSLAEGLAEGDAVEFDFVVGRESSFIDRIDKIDPDEMAAVQQREQDRASALRMRIPRLEEGDLVPSFHLVDQDGNAFETAEFHGKAVAISFIFTRCPVPEFCPRMSNNFRELQLKLEDQPELKERVQLVSITIDPEYDTPEILKGYARTYTPSTENWTFATGEPDRIDEITSRFSIFIDPESEDGMIDHALGTALVDPEGRLARFWWGNRWTTDQVFEAISTTLEDTTN